MEDSFELLEQRVRKAASRLRELDAEAERLRGELQKTSARAEKAEAEVRALQQRAQAAEKGRSEAAVRELEGLRTEREQLRERVASLVKLLATLE